MIKLLRPLFSLAITMLASCASAPGQAPGTDSQREAVAEKEGDTAACGEGFAPAAQEDRVCNVIYAGKCFESEAEACACADCGDAGCLVLESYPAQARCAAEPTEPQPDPDSPSSNGASSIPPAPPGSGEGSSIPPAPPGSGEGSSIPPAPPGSGEGSSIPPAPPTGGGQTPTACAGGSPVTNAASGATCNLIYADQCFENVEDACICAGCAIEDCRILESYPAGVACD